MKIIAKSPCRISLVGGGTDVDPFAKDHGGKIFNFTISLFNQAILVPRQDKTISLTALDENRQILDFSKKLTYGVDKKFDLLRAIINYYQPKLQTGFNLKLTQSHQSLLGLGRSGSVAVATISVFNKWLNIKMTRKKRGLLAANLEINELNWPGGKQDSLAAAFGGFNQMNFGPGNKVNIKPLIVKPTSVKEFYHHSLLIYIGGDRHSKNQQAKLIKGMTQKQKLQALFSLRDSVSKAVKAFQNQDWPKLGLLLDQGWQNKKKSNPAATNQSIDTYYDQAKSLGAFGGKISGSGGAGHMFFICPANKKNIIANALTKTGASIVKFNPDLKGVRIKTC